MTGEEFRSRGATQAPAQDQFNNLPNPIGCLLNPLSYLLNPLSYLLNQFKHLPKQFKRLQLKQLQWLKLKHNWLKSPEDPKINENFIFEECFE